MSPRKRRPPTPTPVPAPTPGLTFSDDFVDLSKWGVSEWATTGLSHESDNMGDLRQCSIVDGMLRIRCERGSTPSGRPWRSGAISTKGKFSQRYGVFQARMKYPAGQGLWPAFWLLDATTEGRRPELDVMEAYPYGTAQFPTDDYVTTNHYRTAEGMGQNDFWVHGSGLTTGFHVYEVEWRQGLIIGRLDGVEKGRITANVPTVPMFLVLDMVVGGWAGLSNASTPSPADLLVDWVKVS